MKGEMGDVAEDEGTLALGGDGQALMAGGVARCRDDGDFVGEVEVALHQPEVVQLLEELADGLGLIEDFHSRRVEVFQVIALRCVGGREEEIPVGLGDDVFGVGEGGTYGVVWHGGRAASRYDRSGDG